MKSIIKDIIKYLRISLKVAVLVIVVIFDFICIKKFVSKFFNYKIIPVDGGRYVCFKNYYDKLSYVVDEWVKIDDEYYYVNPYGFVDQNTIVVDGENWYFVDEKGKMLRDKDEFEFKGEHYTILKNGKMVHK